MAHAAAVTRTLRSLRRRPHGPAAEERAGAVSGVVRTADIIQTASAPALVIAAPREEV